MARKNAKAADAAINNRSEPAKEIVGTTEPITSEVLEDELVDPDAARQDDSTVAVKDLAPANPFHEPLADRYSDGALAEVTQGSTKPAETIVEHPLSPTDTNPNPHGNRDDAVVSVPVKDKDGNVVVERPEDGDTTITGMSDNPVHLGDGRTLAKGAKAKVSKEVAKTLRDNGQAK